MKTSDKIYRLRKNAGISQEKLAEMLNISEQAISKWETGVSKPDAESLIALGGIFDVSIDSLLKEEIDISIGSIHSTTSSDINDSCSDKSNIPSVNTGEHSKPRTKHRLNVAAVLAILTLLAGVFYFALSTTSRDKQNESSDISKPSQTPSDISVAANSVLYLEIYDDTNALTSTASGFIIDDGTTLVTNYHVIEDAYNIVAWTPAGDCSVNVSNIIGYDKVADIAILKCDTDIGVIPLILEDSDVAKQGDGIYAVGYPLGVAHTLSDGVIGARYTDNNNVEFLQITAPISSGSSGGALLSERGEVIGVICSYYVDGQNLNLAISSNMVQQLLKESQGLKLLSLESFYKSFNRPLSVQYVLNNAKTLEGQTVQIQGYLSSALAYGIEHEESAENYSVSYYLVQSQNEVYGYNFDDKIYDLDLIIDVMRNENRRTSDCGAIHVEEDWDDRLTCEPGDMITVSGTVKYYDFENSVFLDDCRVT